ncbi:amidase family protein [Mesorhizobium sp. 1B3]|uniref:amidase family protein n=1 Tax=Mesorhizobium sp. 1B3 TaxID=3243599 RepID=UPI003D98DE47
MSESQGPLWSWRATDLSEGILSGSISCEEVAESCLARIEAVNPQVNAIVDMIPAGEVMAAARRADSDIRRGLSLGPLHGIPVTVKINVDMKGRATTNGVPAFSGLFAEEDSASVANLRRAGAIILGRTNVPAFSTRYFTDNELYGRTVNPWSAHITPGGSSGGAAVAVATGMGAIAHANDRAGSIRYPAYCCGVYGLRPTPGRLPSYNATAKEERSITAQLFSVQGPMARSAEDLRLGMDALGARDPRDPWWVPVEEPKVPTPLRVAMMPVVAGMNVLPEVSAAVRRAGRCLADAGFVVEELAAPRIGDAAELYFSLLATEANTTPLSPIAQFGGEAARKAREGTLAYRPPLRGQAAYMSALATRTAFIREISLFLEGFPLVLMPVSCRPPASVDSDQQGVDSVRELLDAQHPLVSISLLGLPSLVAPVGIVEGVPAGVQLISARFCEANCLAAGKALEVGIPPAFPPADLPLGV